MPYRANEGGALVSRVVNYIKRLQVAKVEEDAESKPDVTVSPIAHRTRGKEKGGGGQLLQRLQLETPTRSTGKRQETSEGFDSTPDFEESMITVLSPVPKELESILYPPTKDEQIVNAALILFLNALTIHFPLFNDWTLHRRAFTVDFRTASFEARTDGYLQDERTGKVRALVEVKPITRKKGGKRIRMQEGAQMVAWICDDKQRPSQSPGRHLHISQDRHEVYLTFAEYDEKYLKYLKGELPLGDPPSFMTMHEFGPWNINSKSHMENLGRIVLAFTIRAHEDQKAESGSVGQGQNKKVGLLG